MLPMGLKLHKRGIYLFDCNTEGEPLVGNKVYTGKNKNKAHYFLILSHPEYNECSSHLSAVSMTTSPRDRRYIHQFGLDNFENWDSVPRGNKEGLLNSKCVFYPSLKELANHILDILLFLP